MEPQNSPHPELEAIKAELAEVMRAESIDTWLSLPNPAFQNRTPLEVIEAGEIDRIRAMIYYLSSGTPT